MNKTIYHFAFSLALSFIVSISFGQNASAYMKEGIEKYRSGKYQESLKQFERVVRTNPDYPGVYEYAGNAYFILRDYARAEMAYTRALEKKYQKNLNTTSGVYVEGNITILEPSPSELSSTAYAMLYNNRGAARLFQGKRTDAMRDFNEAVKLDKNLETASINLKNTQRNDYRVDSQDGGGTDTPRGPFDGPTFDDVDYSMNRPISVPQPLDVRMQKENALSFRDNRFRSQNGGKSGIADIFKAKPFVRRKVPKKGKLYKTPEVGATSHNYITIESVRITQNSTYVNFKVVNRERKSYDVSVAPKTEPGAFFITDRSGSKRTTFKMVDISNIEYYPRSTELAPGTAILFTIEFPKIPDTMGYINIIEGNSQSGHEWNFYNVDLTR